MKKAFTMIELIFVMVIAAILVAMALPRLKRDNLHDAADQLVTHIRYAQHLAMQDDKFSLTDAQWFKGRWQIFFSAANGTNSYMIFSDTRGGTGIYQGNPTGSNVGGAKVSEVAVDPENHSIYLIGTTYASFFGDSNDVINPKLDLGKTYDIKAISLTGGNGNRQKRIFFDNMGRPYRGYNNAAANTNPYSDMFLTRTRLNIHICTVKPCPAKDGENRITIAIEPETGFTHIL